mmetsp:Transcript_2506/g.4059  ORF Transcript_2506/g.4059 Transcript_2506/m.4059 type:complete len:265 (-) Transcript_2506:465-1259(-)
MCQFYVIYLGALLEISIGLQRRDNNVEKPQKHKEYSSNFLRGFWPTQFCIPNLPPQQDGPQREQRAQREHDHREAQVPGLHDEAPAGVQRRVARAPPGGLPRGRPPSKSPVDGSHGPRKADSQKDIDRVRASDVSYTVVSIFVQLSCAHGGEGVGQRGAQRHEGDGGHAVLEAHRAPQQARQVAHQDGHERDPAQGDHEGELPLAVGRGGHQGEEQLPGQRHQMERPVPGSGLLSRLGADLEGVPDLLPPACRPDAVHVQVHVQ